MKRLLAILIVMSIGYAQNQFFLTYEEARDPVNAAYKVELQDRALLDTIVASLNTELELPTAIQVVAAECDDPGAYWLPSMTAIVICYELLPLLEELFRGLATDRAELDTIIYGAIEFIFYHELGHGLIDVFNIPFTGREEDAVDQFSTLILLTSETGVESALAGAWFFQLLSQLERELTFWGEHSLDLQRFYSIICLVYGSDPERYEHLVIRESRGFLASSTQGYLPEERAKRCVNEFKTISNSWGTLINSYVTFKASDPSVTSSAPVPPVAASGNVITGVLDASKPSFDDGEFYSVYTRSLAAGSEVLIELSSAQFDTFLLVQSPDGVIFLNDDTDAPAGSYLSRLTVPVLSSGDYTIYVTSYAGGETGTYTLSITEDNIHYHEQITDALSANDTTFTSGEYYHVYTYDLNAGDTIRVVMTSAEVDTYLFVTSPSGETWVNDDFEGQTSISRLELTADVSGTYELYATTAQVGETGTYTLAVAPLGVQPLPTPAAAPSEPISIGTPEAAPINRGTLSATDSQLDTGEYMDMYSLTVSSGGTLELSLLSDSFYTYLAVMKPSGEVLVAEQLSPDAARLVTTIDESGQWLIVVTSQRPGETGSYTLAVIR
jgi:hypothetical protein